MEQTTTSTSKTTSTKPETTRTPESAISITETSLAVAEPGRTVYQLDPDKSFKYMGNANTRKFHLTSCHWASRTKEKNRVYFKTRDEAIEAGYEPCKQCRP